MTREFDSELTACPDCEMVLDYVDAPEFAGEGLMFATVVCLGCDFSATEEWVIDKTIEN